MFRAVPGPSRGLVLAAYRLMLAGQFMAAYLSDKSQILGYAAAVHHADALLAALDATEGAA